jgi:hypothetical protein
MLDIRFGLIASEIACCPEDVQCHIRYLEYRVEINEDAAQCSGTGGPCTAHAPDVQCDNAIGVFEALAAQPRVMLVNVHARRRMNIPCVSLVAEGLLTRASGTTMRSLRHITC